MDSDESRDGSRDAQSPSSSSSSSSTSSHSRRSSSSDKSDGYKNDHSKGPKSPAQSPPSIRPSGPRSPSPESGSQSPSLPVPQLDQPPSPNNVGRSGSNVDSPEDRGQSGPKSPDPPKSPSVGSDIGSPDPAGGGEGPKTPGSPDSSKSGTAAQEPMSGPGSPDFASQADSPRKQIRSPSSSPSPDRHRHSPPQVQEPVRNEWSPKEKWRRHTKAEQKMVAPPRERSGSESSQSSRSSSYNKRTSTKDPATEEISEGEMESDQEDNKSRTSRASRSKSRGSDKVDSKDHNISHEDLSDVSDLDSNEPEELEKSHKPKSPPVSPEHNVNGKDASTHSSPKSDSAKLEPPKLEKVPQEKTSNTEDGEEQLDFEAEEGECVEPKEVTNGDVERPHIERVTFEDTKPIRRSRGSSLEEGEVSDEGERRPEESEPRPVCRFFSRGACTWGISCRFLHPGVTDKGNYNMFEVVRGLPPGPTPARDVPPPESAWERGLRTAKEMLRIANKRKEQDMDFEEKKLHLSVGGVVHDPDAELAYAAAAVGASPPPRPDAPPRDPEMYRNPVPRGYPAPPMYRGRYRPAPPDERYERGYERERAYERGYERAPQYDERVAMQDEAYQKRRIRPSREVIVQRPVEPERRELRREPRGDEWADPWMRAEPAARKRKPPSSEDSCSSSSSRSSRSPGSRRKRRASESSRLRLSPSVIVRERRLATARATAMNPPAPRRRAASPAAARQMAVNPPPPASHRHKEEIDPYGRSKASSRNRDRKKYSRSSSSGSESSSSSSESESESRSSSTSGSSGARRARHARLLNAAARPLSMNVKNATLAAAVTSMGKKEPFDKDPAKKRGATSPISGGAPAKKSVSRREELLKQLKAVEDAIARKRSKI